MDDSPHITIRPALTDDLEACAALAIVNNGRTLDEWLAGFGAILERHDAAMFVAVRDGAQIVGYGKLQWHDWTGDSGARNVEPGWHLSGVIVDPASGRAGQHHSRCTRASASSRSHAISRSRD